jgi:hypothetical protein
MTDTFYSTAQDVIDFTGIRATDLNLVDNGDTAEEQLVTIIEGWLTEIKDIIDRDRNRDYASETAIPPGIHLIAKRMAANMVAQAVIRRDTPIIRIGEYAVKMVDDTIFTESIRKDLSLYPPTPRFSMFRPHHHHHHHGHTWAWDT